VSPMIFVDKQPYISRVCAHRDVFRKIPYKDLRLSEAMPMRIGISTPRL
jgi:hypothetical protein